MSTHTKLLAVFTLAIPAVLAGCATSRSEISLAPPTTIPSKGAPSVAPNGKTIYLRSITDGRTFEEAPSDPSTPSLGFGGSDQATATVKTEAVGRKRNGFGKALGDVLLQNGATVTDEVRQYLTAALEQAGYRVTSTAADSGSSPIVVDVDIKQFWSWINPGFWHVTVSANIATDLTVIGKPKPIIVSVHTEQEHQFVGDSDWVAIIDQALDAYQKQLLQQSNELP